MWSLSLIPDDWRSKGNDLLWLLVLVGAVIGTTTLVWKLKWLRPTLQWIARRPWAKEITEHADGKKTITYLTPIVKRQRRDQATIQATVQPMINQVLDSIGELDGKNTVQHSGVEKRLTALEDSNKDLISRLHAMELMLSIGNGEVAR